MMVDNDFKLQLLLSCLRITCRYFTEDEEVCKLSEKYVPHDTDLIYDDCHVVCNCDGDINRCDLPDKFQECLV